MDAIGELIAERMRWMDDYELCLNVNAVCTKYGISRMTFYKWLKRYRQSGHDPASLIDRPRRPHNSPMQTSGEISGLVQMIRNETGYGQKKIREVLLRNYNVSLSARTIWKIFRRIPLTQNGGMPLMRSQFSSLGAEASHSGAHGRL